MTKSCRKMLVILLAVGLFICAGAGSLGIAPRSAASADETAIASQGPVDPLAQTGDDAVEPVVQIRGQVVDRDGQPVADAQIAVVGIERHAIPRIRLSLPPSELLAEATSDRQGSYQISLPAKTLQGCASAQLLAIAPGAGLVWQSLDTNARQVDVPLVLPAEQRIRGRLLDRKGLPAAGVRVMYYIITDSRTDPNRSIMFPTIQTPPAAWPQPLTTDEEGRFSIANVPAGFGVWLISEGTERFARHEFLINHGRTFLDDVRGASYLVQSKSVKPDEEALFRLDPARIFTGTVRYEDTEQPSVGSRVIIHPQEPFFTNYYAVADNDAQGRFRISAGSANQYALWAYPPEGSPYMIRRIQPIVWDEPQPVKQLEVTLRRGVLVRGTVIEADSGAAIANASIRYVAEEANNPDHADDLFPDRTMSDPEGRFELAVLPGPGRLLVNGPTNEYVLDEIGSQQLSQGRTGGRRKYNHAVTEIQPGRDSEPIEVKVALRRGSSVTVELTDETGEPADEVRVISLLNVGPESRYNAVLATASGGQYQFSGLADSQEYPAYFWDGKQQRGAAVILDTREKTRQVALKACGQATATLLDSQGNRIGGFRPGRIELVVAPGVSPHDTDALLRGELAAYAISVSQIDTDNNKPGPRTDAQGQITFPALIPGATYQLFGSFGRRRVLLREFTARSGKTISLGEIVIRR